MPYWARVADAVGRQPGRSFGRALDDPVRVGAVAAANAVPRGEALARLRAAAHEAATLLKAHDAASWAATGAHHTRGEMSVNDMVMSLMVEHADEHVRQALEAAGE